MMIPLKSKIIARSISSPKAITYINGVPNLQAELEETRWRFGFAQPNPDKPEPNRKNSPQRRRGRGGRRDFLFFQMQHPTSDSVSLRRGEVCLLCALCVSAVN